MTSTTTERNPIKPKSLTLLELCQTINDLRHTSSRSTAQILTRRLYLHPLTISTNAKLHSTKILSSSQNDFQQISGKFLQKKDPPRVQKAYRGLAVLSTSVPLTNRTTTHTTTKTHPLSVLEPEASTTDFEASTSTMATVKTTLPSLYRGKSSSTKRTITSRSLYIPHQQKRNSISTNRWEKVDVWNQLTRSLQKPTPKDPPTTPLDIFTDLPLQNIETIEQEEHEPFLNSIQAIKIYKRSRVCNTIISNDEKIEENE